MMQSLWCDTVKNDRYIGRTESKQSWAPMRIQNTLNQGIVEIEDEVGVVEK